MLVIPAIDLREGAVVQLVGGDYADERIRLDDPREVFTRWCTSGFSRIHIVDLDAATGRGSNRDRIRDLLAWRTAVAPAVTVQIGGGVREQDDIAELLVAGADAVVVGTRAVEDRWWLEEMSSLWPGRLILAADVRGRRVVTRGWAETTALDVRDLLYDIAALPLAGVLVTAVDVEGTMQGTNLSLFEELAEQSPFPVIASGGIGSVADLRALQDRQVSATVVGMALYTDALDPRAVAQEFVL